MENRTCQPGKADLRVGRREFLAASTSSLLLASQMQRHAVAEPLDVPRIDARNRAMVDAAPLAMQFRGSSAEECRRWQAEFGAKLREMLGPFKPPAKWECVLERRVELSDHVREERVLTAEGVPPVPVYLLLPQGDEKKRAGILAIHGHGDFGYDPVAGIDNTPELKAAIAEANYDYGRQLAARGYVVAAPCLTPFGRRGGKAGPKRGDPCTLVHLQLQLFGKLLISENLRDVLWTLEYLAAHEAVDRERLGCVGLSYGGRMTMMTAGVEPRIRVAVISGALNVFQERAQKGAISGCQSIPGLLEYGDVPEIASLIAPRPCLWEIGAKDGLISPDWAEKALERQRRAYAALGAVDQVLVDRHDGGHQWHGDVAFPLLEKVLRTA